MGGQGSERKSRQAPPFPPPTTKGPDSGPPAQTVAGPFSPRQGSSCFPLTLPAGSLPRNRGSHAQLLAWPDPSTWSRETQAGSSLGQMLRRESQRWTPGFSHRHPGALTSFLPRGRPLCTFSWIITPIQHWGKRSSQLVMLPSCPQDQCLSIRLFTSQLSKRKSEQFPTSPRALGLPPDLFPGAVPLISRPYLSPLYFSQTC